MSTTLRIPTLERALPLVHVHADRLAAYDQLQATRRSILLAGLPWADERRAFVAAKQAYNARLIAIAGAYSRRIYLGRIRGEG